MTTEIAVLNRLGVALASDSTVTVSGIGNAKTFDSADKLFELHCKHPIAIMINGNTDLFGIPWEVIIKDYRADRDGHGNWPINQWARDFLQYLSDKKYLSDRHEIDYVNSIVDNELDELKIKSSRLFWMSAQGTKLPKIQDVASILEAEIDQRMLDIDEEFFKSHSLEKLTTHDVKDRYGDSLDEIFDRALHPVRISPSLKENLVDLIAKVLLFSIEDDFTTGLIFSGYGPDDMFPSVYDVVVNGIVCGRLKHNKPVEIARIDNPNLGYAKSFAEDDVIERVLSGVDFQFIIKTFDFLCRSVNSLSLEIARSTYKSRKKVQEFAGQLEDVFSEIPDKFVQEVAQDFRNDFRLEFERMIAMMPKMELIEFAEALISITAIERKASGEDRSVGGPIDVAFISKHEGFVWIKRKYYFEKQLNPRYFWRKYNEAIAGGGDAKS